MQFEPPATLPCLPPHKFPFTQKMLFEKNKTKQNKKQSEKQTKKQKETQSPQASGVLKTKSELNNIAKTQNTKQKQNKNKTNKQYYINNKKNNTKNNKQRKGNSCYV